MLDYTCVVFNFVTFNEVSQGEAKLGRQGQIRWSRTCSWGWELLYAVWLSSNNLIPGCIPVLPGCGPLLFQLPVPETFKWGSWTAAVPPYSCVKWKMRIKRPNKWYLSFAWCARYVIWWRLLAKPWKAIWVHAKMLKTMKDVMVELLMLFTFGPLPEGLGACSWVIAFVIQSIGLPWNWKCN